MTSISNVQSAINPKTKMKMKILVRSLTWHGTKNSNTTHCVKAHKIRECLFLFAILLGVVNARRDATRYAIIITNIIILSCHRISSLVPQSVFQIKSLDDLVVIHFYYIFFLHTLLLFHLDVHAFVLFETTN